MNSSVLTNDQALVALYLLQDFRRVTERDRPPLPSWFERHGVLVGLYGESRRAARRLVRLDNCLQCAKPLSADSTGDHLVALDVGGPVGLGNYIPLCRNCNSSKRAKDLLEWWAYKGRRFTELPPDVLAMYCRLTFEWLHDRRRIGKPAAEHLEAAVREHHEQLPSTDHKRVLWRRVEGVTGKQVGS